MLQALWIGPKGRTLLDWPREKERWEADGGVLWLDLQAPSADEVEAIGAAFKLNPYVTRAFMHPEHRARLKEFGTQFLLVLNAATRGLSEDGSRAELGRWRTHELNVVVGHRFLITVHPDSISSISLLFGHQAKEEGGKPDLAGLFFAIVETVTTSYSTLLDRIDRQIDKIETSIFAEEADANVVDQLLGLKRHVLYLRRVLGPQRDALGTMMRRDLPPLPPEGRGFAVDLYEHTLRLFELLDTYRDLISSALDAYRTAVSNRTNEIMKTLTIVSTIMLPLTLISGIWGMNFGWIPLAAQGWGFLAVIGLMCLLAGFMSLYFRRRGWF